MTLAQIGHNNPPDSIDEAVAPWADDISKAENWLDGQKVTDEGQMNAVDAILKSLRSAGTAIEEARKADTEPLHKAWKDANARWKPTIDDVDRIKQGLTALVADFKKQLAAEKEDARKAAWEEAQRLEREAEAAAAKADATNIQAQREAETAAQAAMEAKKAASAAQKDTVKGLRTTHHFEVTDYGDLLRWMNKNARLELEAAAMEYVRKNFRNKEMPGVRTWETKEAY